MKVGPPETRGIFEKYIKYRKDKVEVITDELFAFVKEQKERLDLKEYKPYGPINEENVGEIIKIIIRNSGIKREKTKNNSRRFTIAQVHGFRHFFRTALTKARITFEDEEIPIISTYDKEKMMSHKNTTNLSMRHIQRQNNCFLGRTRDLIICAIWFIDSTNQI